MQPLRISLFLTLCSLTSCDAEPATAAATESPSPLRIVVNVAQQRMTVIRNDRPQKTYAVSTSAIGTGNQSGSNRTPLGQHRICEKIGAGQPLGMAFVGRKPTGQTPTIHTDDTDAKKDWILTRILWLEGMEDGVNRGQGIDSKKRYIYIHGTNEEGLIGRPASHGCVRMRNEDVIELFGAVSVGTRVDIIAG